MTKPQGPTIPTDDETRFDRFTRRLMQRNPPWWLFALLIVGSWTLVFLFPWQTYQSQDDLSAKQLARDDAATERARAFVHGLGFEAGPAVCRATKSGSAWCTVRVAQSDRTFALWCSRRHPTCIETIHGQD